MRVLAFNIMLIGTLLFTTGFNLAFHEYAALELDILKSKSFNEEPNTYEEYLIHSFIAEFKLDAEKRGIIVDLDRVSYSIHESLGKDQAFIDRSLEITGTCQPQRKHMQFLRKEIRPDNILSLKSTVYHELGHCILGLGHDESGGISIMSAEGTHWDSWIAHHQEYWDVAVSHMFEKTNH